MAGELESEIRQQLIELGDPMAVARSLIPRWEAGVLTPDELRVLTRFLINSRQVQVLLVQCLRCLKHEQPVPWAALIESLRLTEVKIEPVEIDAIFECADRQENGIDDLIESLALDRFDPRPAELRREKIHRLSAAHEEKREDLIRRLDYARVNRLIGQEKKVLDDIQAFDPDDPILQKEQVDFAFREARGVVEDALAHSPPQMELDRKFAQLPDDLRRAARPLLKELKTRATYATEPELYDFALMLVFMEMPNEAARLIEGRRLSARLDWLLLEVLILGRQYASALGEIESLELKYAGDPETPFALTYARARALWGLGDTVTAIELMKSIARVRPTFRSASTLLQQWIEEAP